MVKPYSSRHDVARVNESFLKVCPPVIPWPHAAGSPAEVQVKNWERSIPTVSQRTGPYVKGSWNPYSYYKVTAGGGPRFVRYNSYYSCWIPPSYTTAVSGNWTQANTHSDTPYSTVIPSGTMNVSEADAIALAKVFAKLSSERAQWNMAVALGEARETAVYIGSVARRISHSYLSLKSGNYKEFYRQLTGDSHASKADPKWKRLHVKYRDRPFDSIKDRASSIWMEANFAVLPLLGDVDSAAKYLALKHVEGRTPVTKVTAHHRTEDASVTYYDEGTGLVKYRYLKIRRADVRYTYEVRPKYWRPNRLEELGFFDPFSLAWELFPNSWLVDYFVNVGQVLQSLHEFSQWEFTRGQRSTRVDHWTYRTIERNFKNNYPYTPSWEAENPHWQHYMDVSRSSASPPTAVPLRVKVANPFDLKSGQFASALIALGNAFNQPFKGVR